LRLISPPLKLFPPSDQSDRNYKIIESTWESQGVDYCYCWMRLNVVVRTGERLSTWSASADHVWRPSSWGWALTRRNWGDYEDCGSSAAPKFTSQSTGRNWWVYHELLFYFRAYRDFIFIFRPIFLALIIAIQELTST